MLSVIGSIKREQIKNNFEIEVHVKLLQANCNKKKAERLILY